jgi:hypothetical protein
MKNKEGGTQLSLLTLRNNKLILVLKENAIQQPINLRYSLVFLFFRNLFASNGFQGLS